MTEDNNNKQMEECKNTTSSNLSSDQLICKSPQESPNSSVKNLRKVVVVGDDGALLCLGLLQFVFGFLMMAFGGLVIHYEASLAQLGGGIWGGCLTMSTGIIGILASARDWCPLRSTPQRITHTIFLALSLVSLAVAQLVVALAATGAARDINNSEFETDEVEPVTTTISPGQISILLPYNYMSIFSNLGLLAASVGEFIVAAIASYKSSRVLCPCFRRNEDRFQELDNRNALVKSWLGKHSPAPQIYIVAPSSLGKGSKLSVPVFALPPAPRGMPYPLIPAPLGTIPSPVIPPSPVTTNKSRRSKRSSHVYARCPPPAEPRRSRSKSKEKIVTEADVASTYTGLDKTIAEEFIDICDSRNLSLGSDSSCTSTCKDCNGRDGTSAEYLLNKT